MAIEFLLILVMFYNTQLRCWNFEISQNQI